MERGSEGSEGAGGREREREHGRKGKGEGRQNRAFSMRFRKSAIFAAVSIRFRSDSASLPPRALFPPPSLPREREIEHRRVRECVRGCVREGGKERERERERDREREIERRERETERQREETQREREKE